MNTFGILNSDDIHIDVSTTEKGAKNYAARHGYSKVSIRFNGSCNVRLISEKNKNGYWKKSL